jgi:exopolysaccharide/PEP-CTERM locus tyrosine autokinase
MSKIQQALSKLRTKNGSADAESDRGGEVSLGRSSNGPIARVVNASAAKEGRPSATNGRIVEVDRMLLRDAGYLAPVDQQKLMADQYRIIKRPLLDNASGKTAHEGDNANLVMVTSALPGDGKTFTAINLAASIAAEKDTAVLLADVDVAKQHVSRLFGVQDEVGLLDVLNNPELDISEAILSTNLEGVHILPAGSMDEFATELLASQRLQHVLSQLSKMLRNTVVIFDSPPLLVTAESRVFAKFVGQIMLVVCAGKTPQGAVLEALDTLDSSKAINLMLNKATISRGTQYYGGYGYYGYGYGNSESS